MFAKSYFDNRAAEMAANILRAQCLDLGLTDIAPYPCGDVEARLKDRVYRFRWVVQTQSVRLVSAHNPELIEVLAA